MGQNRTKQDKIFSTIKIKNMTSKVAFKMVSANIHSYFLLLSIEAGRRFAENNKIDFIEIKELTETVYPLFVGIMRTNLRGNAGLLAGNIELTLFVQRMVVKAINLYVKDNPDDNAIESVVELHSVLGRLENLLIKIFKENTK